MSRPTRTERRAAERREAREAVARARLLEELCRDLRFAVRSLSVAAGAHGPATRELLGRADALLGPGSPNTNTSAHATGARGDS